MAVQVTKLEFQVTKSALSVRLEEKEAMTLKVQIAKIIKCTKVFMNF